MNKSFGFLLWSIAGLLTVNAAQAHPHVWVTMKSELVYAADGAVTGVRHAWAFDEMFSTFATQGLETKQKGAFTREDLAPLAQVNIDSLKDFDYFTIAKANGKKALFDGPANYWLDFTDRQDFRLFEHQILKPAFVELGLVTRFDVQRNLLAP